MRIPILRVASVFGSLALVAAFGFGGPAGCAAQGGASGPESTQLVGEDDSGGLAGESVLGSVPVGSVLKATGNVNLRNGPSTSDSILHVVPKGSTVVVVASDPDGGFYNVKHGG